MSDTVPLEVRQAWQWLLQHDRLILPAALCITLILLVIAALLWLKSREARRLTIEKANALWAVDSWSTECRRLQKESGMYAAELRSLAESHERERMAQEGCWLKWTKCLSMLSDQIRSSERYPQVEMKLRVVRVLVASAVEHSDSVSQLVAVVPADDFFGLVTMVAELLAQPDDLEDWRVELVIRKMDRFIAALLVQRFGSDLPPGISIQQLQGADSSSYRLT